MTERLHFHFSFSCIGEGNGNPIQCSCLENSRDRGAWWAAVYGVAQSRTRLKWLSSSRLPSWRSGKESSRNAGDPGSIPGEGNGNPLQYCLENPMKRGVWQGTVHGSQRVGHNLVSEQMHIHSHILQDIILFFPRSSWQFFHTFTLQYEFYKILLSYPNRKVNFWFVLHWVYIFIWKGCVFF